MCIEERLQKLEANKINAFTVAKQNSVDIDNVNFAIFFIFRNSTTYSKQMIYCIDEWGIGGSFTETGEADVIITKDNKKVTIQNNRSSAVNVIMIYN